MITKFIHLVNLTFCIFLNFKENKHKTEYIITVSYIEIYMEELRDLLDLETSSKDIHVREDEKGNTGVLYCY